MHVIPDEGESARTNEKNRSSNLNYSKKDTGTDTSAYDQVLIAL